MNKIIQFFLSCQFRELTWLISSLDNERRKRDEVAGKAACGHLIHCYKAFRLAWLSCEASLFGFGYGGAGYPQNLLSKFKVADRLGKTSKTKLLLQVYWQLLRFVTSLVFCGLYSSIFSLHLPISFFIDTSPYKLFTHFLSLFCLLQLLFSDPEKLIKTGVPISVNL